MTEAVRTFARIEGGRVVNLELWTQPPEVDGVLFVASTSAQIGDLYDLSAHTFTSWASTVGLQDLRVAALADLSGQRWQATQTFSYDGVLAPADGALGAVVGFVVGAQILAPTDPVTWKLAPGVFRLWTLADVTAYGMAIRAHIQACFDQEADLAAQVGAAMTPAAIAAIVGQASESWPA